MDDTYHNEEFHTSPVLLNFAKLFFPENVKMLVRGKEWEKLGGTSKRYISLRKDSIVGF